MHMHINYPRWGSYIRIRLLTSVAVPREALKQHIEGTNRALQDVEKEIKGWKRKLDARRQQADLLRSLIPVKLVPIDNNISTVM